MLAFLESPRFNTEIRYGTIGGPEFNTDVTTVFSGAEFRNANWLDSRGQWQVADDLYTKAQTDALIAFFRERMGKAGGFRFKDWSDWSTTPTTGVLQTIPGSTTTLQLAKKYVNGPNTYYRPIKKPVSGTVLLFNAGVLVSSPNIDYTTGIFTGVADSWSGEFDVPVRFDTDKFNSTFEGYRDTDGESLFSISGLTIMELRL